MKIELKPCPFCGEEVVPLDYRALESDFTWRKLILSCPRCNVEFNLYGSVSDEHKMCETWNRRADNV